VGKHAFAADVHKRAFQEENTMKVTTSNNIGESGAIPRSAKRRRSDSGSVSSHAGNPAEAHSAAEGVPESSPLPAHAVEDVSSSVTRDVTSSSPPTATATATATGAAAPGRVCMHCRTVKTPLWRNGPHGLKTLCNACGVRFKLGKLQMGANGTTLVAVTSKQPAKQPVLKRARKPSPAPPTPPRASKPKWLRKPLGRQYSTNFPLLTNHDGALLLLQLAGCYTGVL
jgi:hypothetical protein